MIELLVLVFAAGALTHIADMAADGKLKLRRCLGYAAGAAYGFLTSYIIVLYPLLAEIAFAVVLSVILTGKIDSKIHYFGIGAFIIVIIISGINLMGNSIMLLAFLVAGFIDEIGNDYIDRTGRKGVLGIFFQRRMTMEALALAVTLVTGNWLFFVSVIGYEIGYSYVFTESVERKLLRFAGQ
jgi:hypothetical protein